MPSVALGSALVMSLLVGSWTSSSIQADLRVVGKGPTPGSLRVPAALCPGSSPGPVPAQVQAAFWGAVPMLCRRPGG